MRYLKSVFLTAALAGSTAACDDTQTTTDPVTVDAGTISPDMETPEIEIPVEEISEICPEIAANDTAQSAMAVLTIGNYLVRNGDWAHTTNYIGNDGSFELLSFDEPTDEDGRDVPQTFFLNTFQITGASPGDYPEEISLDLTAFRRNFSNPTHLFFHLQDIINNARHWSILERSLQPDTSRGPRLTEAPVAENYAKYYLQFNLKGSETDEISMAENSQEMQALLDKVIEKYDLPRVMVIAIEVNGDQKIMQIEYQNADGEVITKTFDDECLIDSALEIANSTADKGAELSEFTPRQP